MEIHLNVAVGHFLDIREHVWEVLLYLDQVEGRVEELLAADRLTGILHVFKKEFLEALHRKVVIVLAELIVANQQLLQTIEVAVSVEVHRVGNVRLKTRVLPQIEKDKKK